MIEEQVLIWSNEHGMWWRPNHAGYTTLTHEAGRYTVAEAQAICAKANLDPVAPNEVICRGVRPDRAREEFEFAAQRPRPDWPAELTPQLLELLGMPNFQTDPMAQAFRDAGRANIPRRLENEQAFILHWLVGLVIEHGADWRRHAGETLEAVIAEAKARKAVGLDVSGALDG